MASFWGDPTYKPNDKDVVRFIEYIRKITDRYKNEAGEYTDYGRKRVLKVATSALHAITAFIILEFTLKEALALLDKLRAEVIGGE